MRPKCVFQEIEFPIGSGIPPPALVEQISIVGAVRIIAPGRPKDRMPITPGAGHGSATNGRSVFVSFATGCGAQDPQGIRCPAKSFCAARTYASMVCWLPFLAMLPISRPNNVRGWDTTVAPTLAPFGDCVNA